MTAAPLAAPSRTAGRVIRITSGDTLPVARVPVVLHRIGRAAQGPVDTTSTDREGRFAFRFQGDSGAAYLLSVRYDGIQYFSSAIASDPEHPDTAVTILVADTSSSAPVTAHERTLLVSRADETGTRTVVDWLVLQNTGERTRVSPDSLRPSWGAPLPPEAQNVELADATISQFSAEALEFRRDSVLLFAPLSPGRKELVLQYRIPGTLRRFSVPLPAGLESAFVLLEDPRARLLVPPGTAVDSQRIEGRVFRRWAGSTAKVASLEIEFPAPPVSTRVLLPLLVGAAACGFALLAGFTLRRRVPSTPNPLYLADAIARLDAAHLERGSAGSPEEAASYLAERARLKAELTRALAGAPRRS
jgi:5-hydroxyisourate hydrolase-like protein (transthyretin family)